MIKTKKKSMFKNPVIFGVLILVVFSIMSLSSVHALVIKAEIKGVIDTVTADYIENVYKKARELNAEAIIIEMDTPGGLDQSMRKIIKIILNSDIPFIVYVHPEGARAASAGSFILVASHLACMSPGTNVGAAHPVAVGGEGKVSEKIVNDAMKYMQSLAERRGRNVSLAVSFVVNSTSITASEALKYGIIDCIADNYDELLEKLDNRTVEVKGKNVTLEIAKDVIEPIEMSAREKFLHIISDPNIAYILLMLGIYGIIFELANPGAILPGIFGAICLILAFWSFHMISVNAAGVALIILAIILLIAELFTPTHGLLTAGGIISLVLGSLMLIDVEEAKFVTMSWEIIAVAAVVTVGFFVLAVGLAVKAHKRKPETGAEGMIGLEGIAKEDIDPEGMVMIKGELWRAVAKDKPIKKGKKIRVVEVRDLTLVVEEIK